MIRVYLKRIIHFLPYALCYLLAFGFASICIITYGESFIFGDQYSYSQAEIAVCIADDSEYNEIGLNMVSQLDSVGETVELNKMDSEEEVMAAVSKGDCVAGIIIPEGFVNSLSTGENMQAQIYFKDDDSFIGKVVNDLLMTLANMLGTGQCVTITAYSYLSDKDISSSEMYAIGTDAQNRSIAYVLARSDLFDTESIDFLSTFSLKQKMTASYTVFLMVMSVFVFAYFYKGSSDAVMTRVKLSGKNPAVFFLMETGAVAVMMYILYLIVFVVLNILRLGVEAKSLLLMIPVILLVALIASALTYSIRKASTVSFITFGAGLVIMYLSGGLMPVEYMPKFFQTAALYSPVYHLIQYVLGAMFT